MATNLGTHAVKTPPLVDVFLIKDASNIDDVGSHVTLKDWLRDELGVEGDDAFGMHVFVPWSSIARIEWG